MREISPYILENCVNFSPLLFGGFGRKPTFEKIFERVGFDQFWGNFGACTDEKSHFWPEKVGKSPVLKTKSGQKNSEAFSENGTF